jgi:hypothetical protein
VPGRGGEASDPQIVRRETNTGGARVLAGLQSFARSACFEPATQTSLCSPLRRRFRLITAVLDNIFRVSLDPGTRQERFEIDLIGSKGYKQRPHIQYSDDVRDVGNTKALS